MQAGIAAHGRKRRAAGLDDEAPAKRPRPGRAPEAPTLKAGAVLRTPVKSQPTDETVEDFLKATTDQLVTNVLHSAESTVNQLMATFEEERTSLLDAMAEKTAKVEEAEARGAKTRNNVIVQVTDGPYRDQTFVIKPRQRRLVPKVGRSTGRQFVRNGISLPDDPEVSTTHGKFEAVAGKIFFTDLGSTNGSILNGVDMAPQEPAEISDGDVLRVGGTELTLRLEQEE